MQEVDVRPLALERFSSLIGPQRARDFESVALFAQDLLRGRSVVNVNSTATGGGVAELLRCHVGIEWKSRPHLEDWARLFTRLNERR